MSDLIFYLENNGFYPRTEDLEAILRRCDHDADRALSFEEFCEVTELPGQNTSDDNSGDNSKFEMDKSSPLRSSNSNARLDETPAENIDQSWDRKEAERREQEWKDA